MPSLRRGPLLAHVLGWGFTSRDEEVCDRFCVGIAEELQVKRNWHAQRHKAEAAEELVLARR